MKQTAVEWLVEQFENHRATFFKLNDKEERVITLAGRNVVEQAKAMEKEQMDKVAGDWWNEGASYMHDGGRKYESFEQYYEQTYGGNNEQ
jgi:hypothetical protein